MVAVPARSVQYGLWSEVKRHGREEAGDGEEGGRASVTNG